MKTEFKFLKGPEITKKIFEKDFSDLAKEHFKVLGLDKFGEFNADGLLKQINADNVEVLVAKKEKELLGYLVYEITKIPFLIDGFKSVKMVKEMYFYIKPGQFLAKAMLEELKKCARHYGHKLIVVTLYDKKHSNFLKKQGFNPLEMLYAYKVGGE